jgi:putative transposase
MPANGARKYRAYPSPEQAERLTGWGHTCRAIWNAALVQRQILWRERRWTLRSARQCGELTEARAAFHWVADLPAQCAQQILRAMDQAYDNWWNPQHPAGAPALRKRGATLSVSFPGQAVTVEKLNRKWAQVRLPKLGPVRFRLSRPLGGTVRNATVSVDGLGWHVSFGIESATPDAPANGLPGVGVDFGVKVAAHLSDEDHGRVMAPTLSAGEQGRLLALEQQKARQIAYAKRHNGGKYSRRLRRTIAKIAALKARQARRRLDFTHQLTTDLTKNHGWVAIEDLRVTSMTRTARGTVETPGRNVRQKAGLNRSILDNTPGERRRQLGYKARKFGSEIRVVPAPYTSQRCSACGAVDPKSRPGCGREFTCTTCGHADHADRNAAMNIRNKAEGQPASQHSIGRVSDCQAPTRVSRTRAALVDA